MSMWVLGWILELKAPFPYRILVFGLGMNNLYFDHANCKDIVLINEKSISIFCCRNYQFSILISLPLEFLSNNQKKVLFPQLRTKFLHMKRGEKHIHIV